MYCTQCGNQLVDEDNFCRQCGAKIVRNAITLKEETPAQKFWKRLGQAVVWQLQQQAVANTMQQQRGDNFWSSATASGNDNGQSGYVDVGGTIVGYDR